MRAGAALTHPPAETRCADGMYMYVERPLFISKGRGVAMDANWYARLMLIQSEAHPGNQELEVGVRCMIKCVGGRRHGLLYICSEAAHARC